MSSKTLYDRIKELEQSDSVKSGELTKIARDIRSLYTQARQLDRNIGRIERLATIIAVGYPGAVSIPEAIASRTELTLEEYRRLYDNIIRLYHKVDKTLQDSWKLLLEDPSAVLFVERTIKERIGNFGRLLFASPSTILFIVAIATQVAIGVASELDRLNSIQAQKDRDREIANLRIEIYNQLTGSNIQKLRKYSAIVPQGMRRG